MEIEIWTFKQDCWNCSEEMVLWYPEAVGGRFGGTWDPVGEALAEMDESPIGRAYSDVQECDVWGNICPSCGEYYGNFHVWRDANDMELTHSREDIRSGEVASVDTFTVDVEVACTQCGVDEVELPFSMCNRCRNRAERENDETWY